MSSTVQDISACTTSGPMPMPADWIVDGGYLLIIAGIVLMFWGMTFVCEEYSIPAITVFCKRNRISDDVAGAIFIGTGLSLPVLFASFVGLFASNSGIGVGTVVGGNIFNQLVNIALSVHVAPRQRLRLDALVTTRETLFYLLSCLVVVWAAEHDVQQAFHRAFLHSQWEACLSVPWYASLALLGGYVFYAAFDANFARISLLTTKVYRKYVKGIESVVSYGLGEQEGSSSVGSQSVHQSDIFVEQRNGPRNGSIAQWEEDEQELHRKKKRVFVDHAHSLWDDAHPVDGVEMEVVTTLSHNAYTQQDEERGAVTHTHHFAEVNPSLVRANYDPLEDFPLLCLSAFYAKHDFGCFPASRRWKTRFFTLNHSGLSYRVDHTLPLRGPHVRFIDVFDLESVTVSDDAAAQWEVKLTLRTKRKTYTLRALSSEVFDALVARLFAFLEDAKKRNDTELRAMALKSMNELVQGAETLPDGDDDESVGATAFTVPHTLLWQSWYWFTLPLKFLVYASTPDVRHTGSEHRAVLSVTISFLWLGAMTYVLIAGLTELADLLGVNGTVMGLTIAAWASSYPAAWSSIVVARNGFGDIAVCNALGSNVFNNFIGLGLPWMVYSAVHGGKPYAGMQDQGVVLSIALLAIVMILTYVMIALANFELKGWMIPVMAVVYFAFIGYFVYFTLTL